MFGFNERKALREEVKDLKRILDIKNRNINDYEYQTQRLHEDVNALQKELEIQRIIRSKENSDYLRLKTAETFRNAFRREEAKSVEKFLKENPQTYKDFKDEDSGWEVYHVERSASAFSFARLATRVVQSFFLKSEKELKPQFPQTIWTYYLRNRKSNEITVKLDIEFDRWLKALKLTKFQIRPCIEQFQQSWKRRNADWLDELMRKNKEKKLTKNPPHLTTMQPLEEMTHNFTDRVGFCKCTESFAFGKEALAVESTVVIGEKAIKEFPPLVQVERIGFSIGSLTPFEYPHEREMKQRNIIYSKVTDATLKKMLVSFNRRIAQIRNESSHEDAVNYSIEVAKYIVEHYKKDKPELKKKYIKHEDSGSNPNV